MKKPSLSQKAATQPRADDALSREAADLSLRLLKLARELSARSGARLA
jgi:hypothetical protein